MPNDISRLTVPEAAEALGISPEAVRNRLSRGTLDSVKENGRVFVLIDRDMARDTYDKPNDTPPKSDAVVDAKDETIRILEEQLESERAASAELRRIVAGLVQRVPELEPVREPPDAPAQGTNGSVKDAPSQDKEADSRPSSWWHRIFGR